MCLFLPRLKRLSSEVPVTGLPLFFRAADLRPLRRSIAVTSGGPPVVGRQAGCPAVVGRQAGVPAVVGRQAGGHVVVGRQAGGTAVSAWPAARHLLGEAAVLWDLSDLVGGWPLFRDCGCQIWCTGWWRGCSGSVRCGLGSGAR